MKLQQLLTEKQHVIRQTPVSGKGSFGIYDTKRKNYIFRGKVYDDVPPGFYDSWQAARKAKTEMYNKDHGKYQGVLWVVEFTKE